MRIVCQTFSLPKTGREFADYEDAYYPCNTSQLASYVEERADVATFRATVCDGATDSCFSGYWAELLAAGYGAGQWSEDVSEASLVPAQKIWKEFLAKQELPWFAEEKAKLGAFAAVAGLTVEQGGAWRAMAVGDSCLFHTRQGGLVEAFPIKTSAEFSNFPFLIGSLAERNGGVFEHKMTKKDGRWEAGDIFFLMSDAIACWFLKTIEGGIGAQAIAWLAQLNSHDAFNQLVVAERQEVGADGLANMRDDDVTFVKVVIDGRPLAALLAGAQTAPAPRIRSGAASVGSGGAGVASASASAGGAGPGSAGVSPASATSSALTEPLLARKTTSDLTKPMLSNPKSPGLPPTKAAAPAGAVVPGTPPGAPPAATPAASPTGAAGAAPAGATPAAGATGSAATPPVRPDPPKPLQKSVMQVPAVEPVVEPASRAPAPAKLPPKGAKSPTGKPNKLVIAGAVAALVAFGGLIAVLTHHPGKPGDDVSGAGHPAHGSKKAASDTAGGADKTHKGPKSEPMLEDPGINKERHSKRGLHHSQDNMPAPVPAPAPGPGPGSGSASQTEQAEPPLAPQRHIKPGSSPQPAPPDSVPPAPPSVRAPSAGSRKSPDTSNGATEQPTQSSAHSSGNVPTSPVARALGTEPHKRKKSPQMLDYNSGTPRDVMPEKAPPFDSGNN